MTDRDRLCHYKQDLRVRAHHCLRQALQTRAIKAWQYAVKRRKWQVVVAKKALQHWMHLTLAKVWHGMALLILQ